MLDGDWSSDVCSSDLAIRDLTAATASAGGYLVGTDNLGGSFIDMLRKNAVTARMGATFLTGLHGNITIPKMTAGGTAYWLTNEATAITEGNQTLAQISMSPKNVGAYTEVSRQLLLQANPSADAMVMNDLAKTVALAVDAAAISGTGTAGQPTGITNTAGIGSVTGTSLAYAGVMEFQTGLLSSNVIADKPGYVTTPTVAALLMQRQRFTSTDSPLWSGNVLEGKLCDFPALSSNQMAAGTMIFGAWEHLLIGEWGYLEIATNPYANFQGGIIGIRAIQTVDVALRHAAAFSLASSIT
jgi:HK97 family phage major capsid protein